ncbi:hypothetical protein BDV93DRAFT_556385 [Ceratobasidium sp. AG-I]|nr:hypothetical protein BDV93DRAFT_556385 [Ceratobasidium sp. AG-I]
MTPNQLRIARYPTATLCSRKTSRRCTPVDLPSDFTKFRQEHSSFFGFGSAATLPPCVPSLTHISQGGTFVKRTSTASKGKDILRSGSDDGSDGEFYDARNRASNRGEQKEKDEEFTEAELLKLKDETSKSEGNQLNVQERWQNTKQTA